MAGTAASGSKPTGADPLADLEVYDCPFQGCNKKAIGLSHWSRHLLLEHPGQNGSVIDNMSDFIGIPYTDMDRVDSSWRDHIARHLHVQIAPDGWDAAEVLNRLSRDATLSPLLAGRICRDCALAFEKGDTSKRDKETNILQLMSRPRKRASAITFLVCEKFSNLHGKRSEHRTSSKTQAGHLDLEVVREGNDEHVKYITKELELSGQPTIREFLEIEIAATQQVMEAEGDEMTGKRLRRRFGFEPNGMNGQMQGIYLPYKLNRTGEGLLNQWQQQKEQRQKSAEAAVQLLQLKGGRDLPDYLPNVSEHKSQSPSPHPSLSPSVPTSRPVTTLMDHVMSSAKRKADEPVTDLMRPETRLRSSLHQPQADAVPRYTGYSSGGSSGAGVPTNNPSGGGVWQTVMEAQGGRGPVETSTFDLPPRIPTTNSQPTLTAQRAIGATDLSISQTLRQITQTLQPLQMLVPQMGTLASQLNSIQVGLDSMQSDVLELKLLNRNLTRRMHNSRATEPYSPIIPLEREVAGLHRAQAAGQIPANFPQNLAEVHQMTHEELDKLEDFYGKQFGDPTLRSQDSDIMRRRFVFLQYIRG